MKTTHTFSAYLLPKNKISNLSSGKMKNNLHNFDLPSVKKREKRKTPAYLLPKYKIWVYLLPKKKKHYTTLSLFSGEMKINLYILDLLFAKI